MLILAFQWYSWFGRNPVVGKNKSTKKQNKQNKTPQVVVVQWVPGGIHASGADLSFKRLM
jgi:hypothetical protein